MTLEEFNDFCSSLPHTSHVVQWGDAHVWKVDGKVFAICGWAEDDQPAFTFKCSPDSYELLAEMEGLRPAPYLASRGMKWIQWTGPETLGSDGLRTYLQASHRLVASGLPKKRRRELGLA